jgi:YbbR domain-containing protein
MHEIVSRNWPLKLLSLVAAFVIWVSITGDRPTIKDFSIPLEVLLPDNRILKSTPPTTVTVRLEGPAPMIRSLDPLRLAMRVDLGAAELGERDIQLTESNLDVPQGVGVAFFDPPRITVDVDRRVVREIPIKVNLTGELAEDRRLYHVRARPDRLMLDGPESIVDTIEEVLTDPIALDGRERTFDQTVAAVPDVAQVQVVDPQPLEVRLVIDTLPVDAEFDGIPVSIAGQDGEAVPTPETLKVVLTGPAAILDRLGPGQIRAIADVAGLEPRDRSHRVEVSAGIVDVPEDLLYRIRVKSVRPQQISVRLTERSPRES